MMYLLKMVDLSMATLSYQRVFKRTSPETIAFAKNTVPIKAGKNPMN
jgi:hypothetical protein